MRHSLTKLRLNRRVQILRRIFVNRSAAAERPRLSRGCTANSTRSYTFSSCKHGLCISATALLIAAASPGASAQTGTAAAAPQARTAAGPPARRPPLLFKEEWKQNEKGDEHPATQDSVGNPNLELKLYGATAKDLQITGKAGDENNPIHIWSGNCTSPCALALRDKTNFADLTGLARIRWNTKMSGFHQIRPIVKLADGTWLIGDRTDGSSTRDWIVSEFTPADVRWMKIDIARVVTTGNLLEKVDLSKVDEIGFADLMPGSGHGPGGWVDVAQIEVYARAVPRSSASQ